MPEPIRETYVSVYAPIVRNGQALLAFNSQGPYRGTWGLPGGGIEFGETPEEALHREIWEEVGARLTGASLTRVQSARTLFEREPGMPIDFHHIALIYEISLESDPAEEVVSPDSKEKLRWFALEDLAGLPLNVFAAILRE
jgi:ADP-ribose pyrophosphatase YjhB (NUDIX family)